MHSPDYILKRVTPAAISPVSVDEVKVDQRIDHDEEDLQLQALIDAATAHAVGVVGKCLINEVWSISVRCVPRSGRVHLPKTPVQAIESVAYYDHDNQIQSLLIADFYLYGDEDWSYIEPISGVWPVLYERLDALTVTFKTGFGDTPESVPANIRQAVRLMTGHWYANREAVVIGTITATLPMGVDLLLGMSRKGWVG